MVCEKVDKDCSREIDWIWNWVSIEKQFRKCQRERKSFFSHEGKVQCLISVVSISHDWSARVRVIERTSECALYLSHSTINTASASKSESLTTLSEEWVRVALWLYCSSFFTSLLIFFRDGSLELRSVYFIVIIIKEMKKSLKGIKQTPLIFLLSFKF